MSGSSWRERVRAWTREHVFPSSSPTGRSGPRKILVVEDEAPIRRLIQVNLERQGYWAVLAESGQAALEAIRSECPDMIVLDYSLPDMDAVELRRSIRQDPSTSGIPVLALVPRSADKGRIRNNLFACDCMLTKPFNPMELIAFVKRTFQSLAGPPSVIIYNS